MEYFTLADDLEEIQSSKMKLRNSIFVIAGLVILFLLFRGLGFITIEYNKVYLQGNHVAQKEILEVYNEGKTGKQSKNRSKLDSKDEISNSEWGFQIGFSSPSKNKTDNDFQNKEKYLERLIKDKISQEKSLSSKFEFAFVSVEKFEITGAYWLPLIKSGKIAYRISVENKYYEDTYSANFSGDFELEVYGICTVDKLEKIIIEKIANIAVDSIKDDYKK